MEPGPANIGIANGVNENLSRILRSFFTFWFFIPLCFENSPFNKANPEVAIIKPPAIRNAFKLIPKKLSI